MEAMKPKSGIGVLGSQPQSGVRKPRIIVCVTGGRLLFSGVEVARGLVSLGCDVQIVLTMEAAESVTPSAAEAFTNRKPVVDSRCGAGFDEVKINTGEWDVIVVVPATAYYIGRTAEEDEYGMVGGLVSGADISVLFVPDSEHGMSVEVFRENLKKLKERGYHVMTGLEIQEVIDRVMYLAGLSAGRKACGGGGGGGHDTGSGEHGRKLRFP